MPSKKTLLVGIIIVAVSLLIGFIIGTYYGGFLIGSISAVVTFLGGFGLGQVLDVVGLLREWYRSNHEDKQDARVKAIEQLIKHTEDLKPMLKKLELDPLTSANEGLFKAVKKHIETGYPELWSLLEGNNGIKETLDKYSNLEKQFPIQIKNTIKKRVPQNIPLSERLLDSLVNDIKASIEGKIVNNKIRKFQVHDATTARQPEIRQFQLTYEIGETSRTVYHTENLPEKDQRDLSDILNNTIDDAELQNQFKNLLDLKQQLNIKQANFIEKLDKIVDFIEHAASDEDKKLLGNCEYCSNLKQI